MTNGVLCLTFDNMGSAADVGTGKRQAQDPQDQSLVTGFERVLDLLDRTSLKATFFIEGWNAIHNPEHILAIARRGHEIGLHGWVHERFAELSEIQAERVVRDSLSAFRAIGIEPIGFRAPGGVLGDFGEAILKRNGLIYDSSFLEANGPLHPYRLSSGMPSVPWQWEMIDYYQYYMRGEDEVSPATVESVFTKRIAQAAAARNLVTLIFHTFVSAVDNDRFAAMERILRFAALNCRIPIRTAADVARMAS